MAPSSDPLMAESAVTLPKRLAFGFAKRHGALLSAISEQEVVLQCRAGQPKGRPIGQRFCTQAFVETD